MLTRNQLNLLWGIEFACQRCIRAAKYFDVASGTEKNVWAFTQNCYGGICIIHWCQVFGSWSEPTHYSQLFDSGMLANMTKDIVKEKLRTELGLNENEYLVFWQGVKDARDRYLVHYEFATEDKPRFPDTDLLLKTCLVMRTILREIIEYESSEDHELQEKIRHFLSYYTNERYLEEIDHETKLLAQATSERQR
jgi:hypothetical protein